jgi:hypothetical protein
MGEIMTNDIDDLLEKLDEKKREHVKLQELYQMRAVESHNDKREVYKFVADYIVSTSLLKAYPWRIVSFGNGRLVIQCTEHIHELDEFVTSDYYSQFTYLYLDDERQHVWLNYCDDTMYTVTIDFDVIHGLPYVDKWLTKLGISVDFTTIVNPELPKKIDNLHERLHVLEHVLDIVTIRSNNGINGESTTHD